jgi:hypothetical protein
VDTPEWRKWSNIHPTLMRHGMPLFEMSDAQRDRAFAFLRESLSAEGFQTARDVMRLNETVLEMTGRLAEYGEDLYWLSIMGTPSTGDPWGWQIDGHHLNVSFFVLGDQVVMTPAFLGSEPVHAKTGRYAGTRVFKADEDRGLAMIRALSSEQRAKAIIAAESKGEVFTAAFRDNLVLDYAGIRYDELTSAQHEHLLHMIQLHVGRLRPDHAEVKMAGDAPPARGLFCWMGGIEDDSVFTIACKARSSSSSTTGGRLFASTQAL